MPLHWHSPQKNKSAEWISATCCERVKAEFLVGTRASPDANLLTAYSTQRVSFLDFLPQNMIIRKYDCPTALKDAYTGAHDHFQSEKMQSRNCRRLSLQAIILSR